MDNFIKVRGARQHNLKNVDVDIPKNKLVVFTGVSGSGKSSLAFDTIYAEGQRRYVESLSTYARQFLGIMEKPDVDSIEGLSPAISIDQKTTSRNPRSTVGTITEVYDYLRLLFARVGHPHCPSCGREIAQQTLDQIVSRTLDLIAQVAKKDKKAWFLILSPVVNDRKGEFSNLFDNLKAKGFRQVRVDGYIKDLSEDFLLIKTNKHTIEVVIDRISGAAENLTSRLSDSIQQALGLSEGLVIASHVQDPGFTLPQYPKKFSDHLFSEKFACPIDNISLPELEPRVFSFNSPHGACPTCLGLGKVLKVDENLVFSETLTIAEGGIYPFSTMFEHDTWYSRLISTVCEESGIDITRPIASLSKEAKNILLKGTGERIYKVPGMNRWGRETYIWEKFEGLANELERRHSESESDYVRAEIEKYMRTKVCSTCDGKRLKKEALSVTIDGLSISDVTTFAISEAISWIKSLSPKNALSVSEINISQLIINEIVGRLEFLKSVGLEYLTLNREGGTLSGGEAQRIRLASQIGSGLTGVLYVLDEPTIGLHPRDNRKLINTLYSLRDLGNSVIVVEHDREMMEFSDWILDFGPEAGKHGGEIVSQGTPNQVKKDSNSQTGKFISGKRKIDIKQIPASDSQISFEKSNGKNLKLFGCSQNNLKGVNVEFPLGKMVIITGVSGSGKSTLLVETLYPALYQSINPYYRGEVGKFKRLDGKENIDKVILIDQSPIGRTPRSNPATYTKVFDHIREVYAATREARAYGFKKGRFSFNVKGGRCENCEGGGQIKIEMQFMSDIWITCEVCKGTRYNTQTLEVTYKGKNISDILKMTVSEAKEFFHNHHTIVSKLETLDYVGLGYIELGQSATTLSGGEAQRVKLATELSKRSTGKTVYILDEPTTGLHFVDVERLLSVLKMLVRRGNTVLLIEHNIDVVKNADWIIDLGPEGGEKGGELVAYGTPEEVKRSKISATGRYL